MMIMYVYKRDEGGFLEEMKSYISKDYKNVIKRLICTVSIAMCSLLYAGLNANRGVVHDVSTRVDAAIPFNKFFIIPYIIWYGYVGFYLFYFAVYDGEKFFNLLWGIVSGMLFCCVIFYFYPTGVKRPELQGNDIFTKLVRLIYSNDNPYNCCPSIHVLDSVLIAAYVNRDSHPTLKTKIISTIISILIILSTMFVKQHYFIDAVAGAALAYFIYAAFNYDEIIAKVTEKRVPYLEAEEKR